MAALDFISKIHRSTKRDYLARVLAADKAECAVVAKQFGFDYWDGDRKHGYGGYHYDGRWRSFARELARHYGVKAGDRILDVGCGKGFLLHDFTQEIPGIEVAGLDISQYALDHASEDIRRHLVQGSAVSLPFPDQSFDLVLSINTLHNLQLPQLCQALRELQRVSRRHKFIVVDSYRNDREKINLMYWHLTCESFFAPAEWEFIFQQTGYTGDWDFVCFE
jgi:protein-L-isoaspartate(D-aspartate) O-methyltransferase